MHTNAQNTTAILIHVSDAIWNKEKVKVRGNFSQ
jgi:hypothetical protein